MQNPLQAKNTGLQAKNTGVQAKNTGLQAKNTGLQAKNTGLQAKNTGVQAKNTCLQANFIGDSPKSAIFNTNPAFSSKNASKTLNQPVTRGSRSLKGPLYIYYIWEFAPDFFYF